MRWVARGRSAAAGCVGAAISLSLAACTQTSRVDAGVSAASLSKAGKAVAVMRLGAASPRCRNVGVWLGVREGTAFRKHTPVVVINERSLSEVPVAEVELDPGEYHIVAYACGTERGYKTLQDDAGGGGLLRSSYATFTLSPGEIVNVGYLHLDASRVGRNMFGRAVRTAVRITDWPLDELERFKSRRPHIYAQMRTRLMTPTPAAASAPPSGEACDRLRALHADAKVQRLPAACVASR